MIRQLVCIAALFGIPSGALGQSTTENGLGGSIGPYRIGAHLSIQDRREIVGAYYFYARKPIDIPLKAEVDGEHVVLREANGGIFELHFETDDVSAKPPLDFNNSTALVGLWTGNGRTLPVRLGFNQIGGAQGAERYADVTNATASAFETMVQHFIHGVISGDKLETAGAVSFPVVIGAKPADYIVDTPAQLDARWSEIFTACFVARLRRAIPHEMFVHDGSAMLNDGQVWFGARGATSLYSGVCQEPPITTNLDVREKAFIEKRLGLSQYKAVSLDLDRDGIPELLVYRLDRDFCGSGGCNLLIIRREDSGFLVVGSTTVTQLPIRILSTYSKGWRDLGVWVAGGGIWPGYEARLRYDGETYPANPTMAPAIPLRRPVGQIVLK